MCNVVYAYLIEGRDAASREEFDQNLYAPPGAEDALTRLLGGG